MLNDIVLFAIQLHESEHKMWPIRFQSPKNSLGAENV